MSGPADFAFELVDAVVDRLNADLDDRAPLGEKAVGFLEPPTKTQRFRVVCYALADEPAASVGGASASVQRVTSRIGVAFVVRASKSGGRARAKTRTGELLKIARERLVGWTPPVAGADSPLAWDRGQLEEIDEDGRAFWADRYSIEWVLDSQSFRGA
ncbi:MAG: hypothetical protein F4Y03_09345 [Alphaproteobacteria bacterium]|nr:hypothetical protein [Alphaproteobacteria bacterium]